MIVWCSILFDSILKVFLLNQGRAVREGNNIILFHLKWGGELKRNRVSQVNI